LQTLESGATWNLVRIQERALLLNGDYYYNSIAGSGVNCYILDSGVEADNVEFQGRATALADFTGEGFQDVIGHGTHVTGIIGAKTYGVAKKVQLIAVKVVYSNGVTDSATLIAALNWVYSYAQATGVKSLINLSLSGPLSASLNSVVTSIVANGIPIVVAAGNNGDDACQYSPGSAVNALAIGATDDTDSVLASPPSNIGACIDMFAPGGSVLSTYIGSTTALAFMSGTSMASPHVVGALAITWSAMPTLNASALIARMVSRVSVGYLLNIPAGTMNYMVYGAKDV